MRTMTWQHVEGVFILVHGNQEPSDEEWNGYVDAIRERVDVEGEFKALVVTPGPGPNMRQRQRLATNVVANSRQSRTAVVTSSTIGRAITTLVALRTPDIRAFDPEHLDDAFAHVGIAEGSRNRVRSALNELRNQIGLPGTL